MTREELLKKLKEIEAGGTGGDEERDHIVADRALLEFINDPEISEAFHSIKKWYA